MLNVALTLNVLNPGIPFKFKSGGSVTYARCSLHRRRQFSALARQSLDNLSCDLQVSSDLNSIIGSPASLQTYRLSLKDRQIYSLNFLACAAAASATMLCVSLIPTLLAFKRTAESMEKLMDVVREEIPGTMMAVRLSGMEISDITMQLSDASQEVTPDSKSSNRAIHLTEERLTQLTHLPSIGSMKVLAPNETGITEPAIARAARGIREGITKSRGLVKMLFTLTRFFRGILSHFSSRAKA